MKLELDTATTSEGETSTSRLLVAALIGALISPTGAAAQASRDVWRTFAAKIDPGTELQVRLQDGKCFRATLVGVDETVILLQPKTRVPVAVQSAPLDAIVSLERPKPGIGPGKAAAIGIGTGVGVSNCGRWPLLLNRSCAPPDSTYADVGLAVCASTRIARSASPVKRMQVSLMALLVLKDGELVVCVSAGASD